MKIDIAYLYKKCIFTLLKGTKVRENRIFFESFHGEKYSDSIKVLYEYMKTKRNDMQYVWVYNKEECPIKGDNLIIVKRNTLKYFYYNATSKYWVTNSHRNRHIAPKKNQIYMMIWHGVGAFKKFGADIKRPKEVLEDLRNDGNNITYLVCSSENIKSIYSGALCIDQNKIYPYGLPRNDIFYDEDKLRRIKNKYKDMFPQNKKIILYAPTHRAAEKEFDFKLDVNKLYKELNDEYILLIKSHYFISEEIQIDDKLKEFVYDVSYYDDIQELLVISDILITDYSSVFYDFGFQKNKPVLFYAYDKDEYIKNWGGFYKEYDSYVPGPILYSTDELAEAIKNKEILKNASERLEDFMQDYDDYKDGKSTERVYKLLFSGENK